MVTGIDYYDTHLSEVHIAVVAPQHVEDQIVCVGRSLYPRGASADEDEGEQPAIVVASQALDLLETVDYVVAYPEGVPQTLDVHGVLLSSRSAEEGGPAARRQDEVVVGEDTLVRLYFAGLEVYPRDLFLKELYSQGPEDAPDSVGDVSHLHVPRDDRRDHRPEDRVVHPIEQGHAHVFA